jgi:hypothetical protein
LYPADSLADRYAAQSDEELSALPSQLSSLTDEASTALQHELHRRGLEQGVAVSWATSASRRKFGDYVARIRSITLPRGIWSFIHLVVAAVFLPTVIQYFIYDLFPPLRALWLPFAGRATPLTLPFFPLQSLIAFLVGDMAARSRAAFWSDKSAEETWIVPSLGMVFLLISYRPQSLIDDDLWHHFFWPGRYDIPFFQMMTTLPFMMSACYAIGHMVGRRTGSASPARRTDQ